MAATTKIEWTEATWNPITGCSLASPGCTNCYAMQLAGTRLAHIPSRKGLTQDSKAGPVWTGEVRFNAEFLDQPLRWKRPRMIFVCAHGDLFHESVPDAWIDRIFAVMALCPQHTFQVLTKRSARMREYLANTGDFGICHGTPRRVWQAMHGEAKTRAAAETLDSWYGGPSSAQWPLPNVWLGVSVEDQQRADERIPDLLATPAALRWISAEPLLGPVDLETYWLAQPTECERCDADSLTGGRSLQWCPIGACPDDGVQPRLDWVVVGGESGAKARGSTAEVEQWMRSLRDQCAAAGVPFFGKQNYRKLPLPEDLMVREYPHG